MATEEKGFFVPPELLQNRCDYESEGARVRALLAPRPSPPWNLGGAPIPPLRRSHCTSPTSSAGCPRPGREQAGRRPVVEEGSGRGGSFASRSCSSPLHGGSSPGQAQEGVSETPWVSRMNLELEKEGSYMGEGSDE
jgi:hypothetical protein